MRLATDDAIIAIPAAKLGLGYRVDGLKPLVDIIGPSYAMELFYTARKFDADEAEMTRSRKLRRGFLYDRYSDIIEAMYDGKKSAHVQATVTYQDGSESITETEVKIRQA